MSRDMPMKQMSDRRLFLGSLPAVAIVSVLLAASAVAPSFATEKNLPRSYWWSVQPEVPAVKS